MSLELTRSPTKTEELFVKPVSLSPEASMRLSSQLPLQQRDPVQSSEHMDRHHHNHHQVWLIAISGNFSGHFSLHTTTLWKDLQSMDLEGDKAVRVY